MIHLDTSFLIRALIPGTIEERQLRSWLAGDTAIGMSAVSWAEFLCGPLSVEDAMAAAAFVGEAVSLTADQSVRAAELFNSAGRRRGSFVDCLIAACAIGEGAALAAANPSDFARMPGVRLA